ncbi:radical SAM superfamily enzyme YgiQ (UPF0313 family) [Acetoanaerobium pronyense]|uniref:Radical SAM superfamily enzyme YgiQ (UPF0313 family) n=1 Tax=Acetoanaerobium pronyense TaxID=1482736 RepID=A0ABS4KHS8_9FIRM|nr:radical SAM protein [Acetoanaerobium pronyense]MBP2027322.1 radical SAM superfamily enzyme YgiQ (UPF0313 family) [Acetoanaerobium pronyense]
MKYEGSIYRPPSEARSLIVQVAVGCAHNKCTFCSMYKDKSFRIKSWEEIKEDLDEARENYRYIKRIFLADGDALVLPAKKLIQILDYIKEIFPECERVGIYAAPKDILLKSEEDLKALKESGLGIVYIGIESGDDQILKDIEKGVSSSEIISSGQKLKAAQIPISITLISGIGGKEKTKEHAIESARVVNRINPEYVSFLTLMLEEGTPLYEDWQNDKFSLLSPKEVLEEIRLFIENTDLKGSIFRANHASNYISLGGILNEEKDELLKNIDEALSEDFFKPEHLRGL